MNANNDIEVTIANGFLTVKSTNNANASIEHYPLDKVTSVDEYFQDWTALEADRPGRVEHLIEYSVILGVQENPTDLVTIDFDIQDVTNQPTWTPASRVTLAQAITDIQAGIALASNPVPLAPAPPLGPFSGSKNVTTAATAVPLTGASTPMTSVDITALSTNTKAIVYGGATVVALLGTRVGTPLEPGDTVTVDSADLNGIYIDAEVGGEGVTFNYFN
jgi:hypothetical protein